ncbi:hypothetical protein L1987_42502 [Smallanthus sonchifolius]|uniref:Uncharacterized protein n=1 Tax=Smallanthus sonchifolius TaxID=185202 RepID=A0ACB9GK01_9ASTR|nr:hypothetical protein L1987_42502 [Smallanthus sonchifolius]
MVNKVENDVPTVAEAVTAAAEGAAAAAAAAAGGAAAAAEGWEQKQQRPRRGGNWWQRLRSLEVWCVLRKAVNGSELENEWNLGFY